MTMHEMIERAHGVTGAGRATLRTAAGSILGTIRARISHDEFHDILIVTPGALSLLAAEMREGRVAIADRGHSTINRGDFHEEMAAVGLPRESADLLCRLFFRFMRENGGGHLIEKVTAVLLSAPLTQSDSIHPDRSIFFDNHRY